jgi:hypothetical protein
MLVLGKPVHKTVLAHAARDREGRYRHSCNFGKQVFNFGTGLSSQCAHSFLACQHAFAGGAICRHNLVAVKKLMEVCDFLHVLGNVDARQIRKPDFSKQYIASAKHTLGDR